MFLRGIHYRQPFFYQYLDFVQTRAEEFLRFRLAANFIKPKDVVLDLCAGIGQLKRFTNEASYIAVEASPPFIQVMKKKGIRVVVCNLHEGLNPMIPHVDVAVMIISLCHFRNTSVHVLLEELKRVAARVVIIERIVKKKEQGWFTALRDYLCAQDYYYPTRLFTEQEFKDMMLQHQYRFYQKEHRYCVGIFGEK